MRRWRVRRQEKDWQGRRRGVEVKGKKGRREVTGDGGVNYARIHYADALVNFYNSLFYTVF